MNWAKGRRTRGRGTSFKGALQYVLHDKGADTAERVGFIELRNESSLEMHVEGTIDILFSDSDMPIREAEVKRYLPQIRSTGLILMHDASSHLKIVRDAAFSLEAEGLVSCIFLPTPRGLVLAQKREGRA